jgi:hypothetical protein
MPFEGVKIAAPPAHARTQSSSQASGRTVAGEKKLSTKGKAREEAANGVGQIISFGCMVAGQLADAGAVGIHWPNLAHEAASIAETDEKMASGLDKLLEIGPYGNFIVVLLPFVGQILVNHKVVRAEAMGGAGAVHPEVLEAQVKAHMARQQATAIQQQREAEAELTRLMMEAQGPNGSQSATEPAAAE